MKGRDWYIMANAKGADLTLDQSYIRLFLKLPRACVLFSQNSRIRSVVPLIF